MSRKNEPVHDDEDSENADPNVHPRTRGGEPTAIFKKLLSPAHDTIVSNNAVSYLQKVKSFITHIEVILIVRQTLLASSYN